MGKFLGRLALKAPKSLMSRVSSRLVLTAIAATVARASATAFVSSAPALRSPLVQSATAFSSTRQGHRFMSTIKAQGSPKEIVDNAIKENKVMVFSKTFCPFCVKAKQALDSVGAKYEVLELDERDDGGDIQDVFVDMTGARSVPRVFIDGKFIGGGDDVAKLMKSGELAKMV